MTSSVTSSGASDRRRPSARGCETASVIAIATSWSRRPGGRGNRGELGQPGGCRRTSRRIAALEQRDAGALVELGNLCRVGLGDQARPGEDRAERVLAVPRLERRDLDRLVPLPERLLVDE